MTSETYRLLVAFPDQSAAFTSGFESGMLYQRMATELGQIETTIHTENREVLVRCCAALGWQVEFKETEMDEWTAATLTRASQPALRAV